MTKQPGPSVRRRQLGAMLRQLRQESRKTVKDAADWLSMGESNISKIEKSKQTVKAPTIRALCQLYDVDASKTDYLLRLAGEASQRGWWTAYRDTVPEWFRQYVGLESDALDYWSYETEYVPGLLQTSEYVAAMTRAALPGATDAEVERPVQLRRDRQERLNGGSPPRLHLYINEAVVRRSVGGPDVMREQLDYMIECSKLDHVFLRVLPFSAGAHPAMSGAFVLMQFPEEESPAFAYIENERGAVYQEDPGDIDRYTVMVNWLDELALSEDASRDMLADVSRSL